MYTWGDIQIASIEKMQLNNVPIIVTDLPDMREDRKYRNYLSAMPQAANEALLRLMKVGKPLIKKFVFNQNIPSSILDSQSYETYTVDKEDVVAFTTTAHAYYFEVDNTCQVLIDKFEEGAWSNISTLNITSTTPGKYVIYKGLITNPNNSEIRITFKASYLYNVRNIALYNVKFRTVAEIFDNVQRQKYDLKELIDDFYKIVSIEYEENGVRGKYVTEYDLEGDNILVLDTKLQGNFIITYKAYPDKITSNTSDSYEFTTPVEMVALIPYYIVSELYKEDDISVATMYRNQFETGLQEFESDNVGVEFVSNSGWL